MWEPGGREAWHRSETNGWRWKSPDRLDACVWALSQLMLTTQRSITPEGRRRLREGLDKIGRPRPVY